MNLPFNPDNAIVEPTTGRAQRFFIQFLENLFNGVIPRTTYTFAQIDRMTPTPGNTVICSDSSVTTIGSTLAGGGTDIVQAIGNGTDWKVL